MATLMSAFCETAFQKIAYQSESLVAVIFCQNFITVSVIAISGSTHTHRERKLGESLPYLNAIVTSETLQCVCGQRLSKRPKIKVVS